MLKSLMTLGRGGAKWGGGGGGGAAGSEGIGSLSQARRTGPTRYRKEVALSAFDIGETGDAAQDVSGM
jgi:hypothetical protein